MLTRWQSTIVDAQGNIQPFAILTILNEETQAPAQIYASESESQPLPAGTVVADESGYAYFYARGGRYRIQADDLSIDWRHVPLGSAATRDVGTGSDEIPTNSDLGLGAAATLDVATTEQAEDLIDDDVVITPKKLGDSMNAHVLGMGQTWQDFTGSRSIDTIYTNTTGRPIAVSLVAAGTSAAPGNSMSLLVEGESVYSSPAYSTTSTVGSIFAVVPVGATYRLVKGGWTALNAVHFWKELR